MMISSFLLGLRRDAPKEARDGLSLTNSQAKRGAQPVPQHPGSARPATHRQLLGWLIRFLGPAFVSALASTAVVAGGTFDGIPVMEHEKSMAETYLPILNLYGPKNTELYADGIRLYAEAKADFDGLITQLEVELDQPRPPSQSHALKDDLNKAVAKRVAFTSFVEGKLLPHTEGAQKGIVDAFVKGAGELTKELTNACIAIWREYRSASEARKKDLRQDLEFLRWPPFVPTAGKPG
jgi:hypothetical protein